MRFREYLIAALARTRLAAAAMAPPPTCAHSARRVAAKLGKRARLPGRLPYWPLPDKTALAVKAEHQIGLIGTDLLERFVVKVDFDHKQLLLYKPDTWHYEGPAQPQALTDAVGLLAMAGTLEGDPVSLLVDTGSSTNLIMNAPFVREHNLFNRLRCTRERPLAEGVGGLIFGRRAAVDTLVLNGVTLPTLGIDLTSMRSAVLADTSLSGVLGLGALKRFNLVLDMPQRRIYLEPNSHFHDADIAPVSLSELY